jgi:hypothetical protein
MTRPREKNKIPTVIKILAAVFGFIVLISLIASLARPSTPSSTSVPLTTTVATTSAQPTFSPAPSALSAAPVAEAPAATTSQVNAVKKAQSYLEYSGFSRKGLIKQLAFEGFSNADATYGADHAGASWTAEAEQKAQSYMDYSSFSRVSLIKQLKFEGFTADEAAHGADSVGL